MPGSVRGVALTLTVDRARWREHVAATRAAFPGLVPVVKGNGYGFGLTYLAELVSSWEPVTAGERAAGERRRVRPWARASWRWAPSTSWPACRPRPPAAGADAGAGPRAAHRRGPGRPHGRLGAPRRRAGLGRRAPAGHRQAGQPHAPLRGGTRRSARPPGRGRHAPGFPSTGSRSTRRWRARATTTSRPFGAGCPRCRPTRSCTPPTSTPRGTPRCAPAEATTRDGGSGSGTALWHGDKSSLHLTADVLDVRPVRGGDRVGYRAVPAPADGSLVMVTAGTAHGVHPLAGRPEPVPLRPGAAPAGRAVPHAHLDVLRRRGVALPRGR